MASATDPTRLEQPIILVRGFGGLSVEDEKRIAYQGFNDGTVYPQKRGENYIYEGLILRFMKSRWIYRDATNVVGYYADPVTRSPADIPKELKDFDPRFFAGSKVVIDPAMAAAQLRTEGDLMKTLWVFRYYDLNDRRFPPYGEALVRLIKFIRALAVAKQLAPPKVNIIAHSMGGLIVREAVQRSFPADSEHENLPETERKKIAETYINKIVTLGTPHRGISFQIIRDWLRIDAQEELEHFNPEFQKTDHELGYQRFAESFDPRRILTVVGTNYRTYGPVVASWLNRAFSVANEFGPNYNRSDGLVKQTSAQLPGAPRTFVHKCHGGPDSLVTSREAFEIATRFFFGNINVRLSLVKADVTRGFDIIGKSELFFGVSIKPRGVDFELLHQSAEAENTYGPFSTRDFNDPNPAFAWAGEERLIWEGWLDTTAKTLGTDKPSGKAGTQEPGDIVMRLDFYVGERDLFGFGFSDNVVFRKQYYIRGVFESFEPLKLERIELHTGEELAKPVPNTRMSAQGWEFDIGGTGFEATLRLNFATVPDVGHPKQVQLAAPAGKQ
jgi:pimeloyl-ACP methyl ester carboxylesterase